MGNSWYSKSTSVDEDQDTCMKEKKKEGGREGEKE